jgi:hypothetical protein
MEGAQIFGIVVAPEPHPEVAWLEDLVPVTDEILARTGDVDPQQVFRITAACQESKCVHFDGSDCNLAQRIVQILPAVTDSLPPCRLRASCRWFLQEGGPACQRCPQVITHNYEPTEQVAQAATPA